MFILQNMTLGVALQSDWPFPVAMDSFDRVTSYVCKRQLDWSEGISSSPFSCARWRVVLKPLIWSIITQTLLVPRDLLMQFLCYPKSSILWKVTVWWVHLHRLDSLLFLKHVLRPLETTGAIYAKMDQMISATILSMNYAWCHWIWSKGNFLLIAIGQK